MRVLGLRECNESFSRAGSWHALVPCSLDQGICRTMGPFKGVELGWKLKL